MFSKNTEPFDFIKCNVIQKLAYEVKYIDEINGGLIVFQKFESKSFWKISCLDCEYYGKNQYKTKKKKI